MLTSLVVTMMIITYMAEVSGQLTWWSICGQFWALPFLVYLRVSDINKQDKWTTWAFMTLLLIYPWGKFIISSSNQSLKEGLFFVIVLTLM